MPLSHHYPYTNYAHGSTSGRLADLYISASQVKYTTIDQIEYANQCQQMDASGFA